LAAGSYRVEVFAQNAGATPAAGYEAFASTTYTLFVAPGAPTGVSATVANAQSVVSFTAPASNGGSPITSFTVTATPGTHTATGPASPLTVTGLTNGIPYTITVTATNAAGAGPASASVNVMPALPVASVSFTNINPAVPSASGASVTFTAQSVGGSETPQYFFQWRDLSGIWHAGQAYGPGNSWTWNTTGLAAGSYRVEVFAKNAGATPAGGYEAFSVTFYTLFVAPGAPTGVTATVANSQSKVSFSAPASNGGSAIPHIPLAPTPAT
jgi:hypothetical protein